MEKVQEEPRYDGPELMLPLQTYQHMIGRSFGIAFNDRSFVKPQVTPTSADGYYYGNLGKSSRLFFGCRLRNLSICVCLP